MCYLKIYNFDIEVVALNIFSNSEKIIKVDYYSTRINY